MDITENYSLLPHKGNFPGKSKSTQICLEYSLSISLLSTLTTYVTTNEIVLIQGIESWISHKIIYFYGISVIFLEKRKTRKARKYAQNIAWSSDPMMEYEPKLFTLTAKGNFLEKSNLR